MTVFSRPVPVVLLTLCGCLAVALLRQFFSPNQPLNAPSVPSRITIPSVPALPDFQPPPSELLVEISGRPIFNPERQPIDPDTANRNAPPPAPQLTFVGTFLESGEQIAMVKMQGTAPALNLKRGSTVAGWLVSDISPERILLIANSASFEVKLNRAPAPGPVVAQANSRRNPSSRRHSTSALASAGRPTVASAVPSPPFVPPPAAPLPNPNLHFRGVQVR